MSTPTLMLKEKNEREINRGFDEAANFKKAVKAYNTQISKDFADAVEAARCAKFCDEMLDAAAAALDAAAKVISDKDLKELCCKPLEATTDSLKLKELEERFPGATMVLSLEAQQCVVKYVYEDLYEDSSINHMISCEGKPYAHLSFTSLSCKGRPQLMAEWRGMYIDLSHLF